MKEISYRKIKHNISIFFTILSGILLVLMTISTIFITNTILDKQAQQVLDLSLKTTIQNYNTNNLQFQDKSLQRSNLNSLQYIQDKTLPNIQDKIPDSPLNQYTKLKENKDVYSRVVKSNGDILFSSDLFDQFLPKYTNIGFYKLYIGDFCLYTLTSKLSNNDLVQVGQYCSLTNSQQIKIIGVIVVITLGMLIITYLIGRLISRLLLRPMENTLKRTREFTQDVYHELLTPISVAITTVEVATKTKKYEKGIISIKEDLKSMYDSLNLLHSNTLNISQELINVDLKEVLNNILNENSLKSHNYTFDLSQVRKVYKSVNLTLVKIIFQNLIQNAIKYSKNQGSIVIILNKEMFSIENDVLDISEIEISNLTKRNYRGKNTVGIPGHGLGLSIVKELTEEAKWNLEIKKNHNKLKFIIVF